MVNPVKGAFKKPTRKAYPELATYCDQYFGDNFFDKVTAYAVRSDGCYIVLATEQGKGRYDLADVASPNGRDWEMQNDGSMLITEADLRVLYIAPQCDWYVIPGNPNFASMGVETGHKASVVTEERAA